MDNKYRDEKWEMLGAKSKMAIITASALVLFGMGMSIAGFCVSPIGEISSSVMMLFGQSLIWSGAIYGISIYLSSTKQGIVNYLFDKEEHFNERLEELEKNKQNES